MANLASDSAVTFQHLVFMKAFWEKKKDKPINWFVNTVVEVLCIMEATLTLVVTTRMLILWLTDSGDEEDKNYSWE